MLLQYSHWISSAGPGSSLASETILAPPTLITRLLCAAARARPRISGFSCGARAKTGNTRPGNKNCPWYFYKPSLPEALGAVHVRASSKLQPLELVMAESREREQEEVDGRGAGRPMGLNLASGRAGSKPSNSLGGGGETLL